MGYTILLKLMLLICTNLAILKSSELLIKLRMLFVCAFVYLLAAYPVNATVVVNPSKQVSMLLDSFHSAASTANGIEYFKLLSEDAIFLGTDSSERWTKDQFKKFAEPYFSTGRGWTYIPKERHIHFVNNSRIAIFDELLTSRSYGITRGSGVLQLTNEGWKIIQYSLSIPIPNDLAKELTNQIKEFQKSK